MTERRSGAPGPAGLADLLAQLERDHSLSPRALRRRDGAIGRELRGLRPRPAEQLLAWLGRVHEDVDGWNTAAVQRTVTFMLFLTGIVAGSLTALAAFFYDGSGRVNVISVIAIFVGIQGLFLLAFAIASLPSAVVARLPGVDGLVEAARLLSPGRLGTMASRILPSEHRASMKILLGRARSHRALFADVTKWLVLGWSQSMAVAFNLAAIATAFSLVVFTDLAFGWATTLQATPETIHRIAVWLAVPWRDLLPVAVPSIELIEVSRYFRLESGHPSSMQDVSELGGWWPFVLCCMLVYGLVPRVLAYLLTAWRLRTACARAMLLTPGVDALLDRLNAVVVETQADEAEAEPPSPPLGDERSHPQQLHLSDRYDAVNWSEVPVEDEVLRDRLRATTGVAPLAVHRAGGTLSLEQDRELIARLAASDGIGEVVIVTKGWEPPLLDLIDFARELRNALDAGRRVVVLPVSSGNGSLGPVSARESLVWQQSLQAVGDPWLCVAELDDMRR
jgi:hypothetical protein